MPAARPDSPWYLVRCSLPKSFCPCHLQEAPPLRPYGTLACRLPDQGFHYISLVSFRGSSSYDHDKSQNTKTSRQPPSWECPLLPAPALATCLGRVLHAPAKLLRVSLVLLPDLLHLLVPGGHLLLQGPLQGCQLTLAQPQLLLEPLFPLQDLFQKFPGL